MPLPWDILQDIKRCVTLPTLFPVRCVDRSTLSALDTQIRSACYLQIFLLRTCLFPFTPKTLGKNIHLFHTLAYDFCYRCSVFKPPKIFQYDPHRLNRHSQLLPLIVDLQSCLRPKACRCYPSSQGRLTGSVGLGILQDD